MLATLDSNLHVLITCQEGAVGSGAGGCKQSGENLAIDSVGTRAGARVENGAGPMTGVRASPVASAGVSIPEAGAVGGRARGGGQGAYLWSHTTLFRALRDIGFTFSKRPNHYDVAREKPSMIRQQEDFIDTLRLQLTAVSIAIHAVWSPYPTVNLHRTTDGPTRLSLLQLYLYGEHEQILAFGAHPPPPLSTPPAVAPPPPPPPPHTPAPAPASSKTPPSRFSAPPPPHTAARPAAASSHHSSATYATGAVRAVGQYGGLDDKSLPRARAIFTSVCEAFSVPPPLRAVCLPFALHLT